MQRIALERIPNQSFAYNIDGSRFVITIKENVAGLMTASISRDSVTIIENTRCLFGIPLMPYEYQENGNFMFLTENDELPYYTAFEITQSFIYMSQSEIEAILNG